MMCTQVQFCWSYVLAMPSKLWVPVIEVMGSCSCTVKVSIHGKTALLPLVVVKGDGISCWDRNWLEEINWIGVKLQR